MKTSLFVVAVTSTLLCIPAAPNVTDPVNLTEPYSAEIVSHCLPNDSQIYEITCDVEIAMCSTQNAAVLEK